MIQYYFQINPPSVNVSIQTDSEFANQYVWRVTLLKTNNFFDMLG